MVRAGVSYLRGEVMETLVGLVFEIPTVEAYKILKENVLGNALKYR